MTDQPDLFGRPAPCDVRGSTPCPAETGMFCRCRSQDAGHTGPHLCVDCANRFLPSFDPPPNPPHNKVNTSIAAASSIRGTVGSLREQVYRFVEGEGGATCWEVEAGLGLKHQTASARLNELEFKYLLIAKSEEQRPNPDGGRKARVYQVTA